MNASVDQISTENSDLESDLIALKTRLKENGLFEPDRLAYILRASWIVPLYIASWYGLIITDSGIERVFFAIIVAVCSVQGAAIAHEAGHGAVTNNKMAVHWIGQCFMSFIMGSSFSSWKAKHNAHHAYANSKKDPDMQAGIFCFNEDDALKSKGLQRFFTSYQHILIWPLLSLMAFSFKRGSVLYIKENPKTTRVDQAFLLAHLVFWIAIPSMLAGVETAILTYLLITWFKGIYLAFIFVTNHMGRPQLESLTRTTFAYKQIISARNIHYSWFLTRVCSGLISHIEHHLFCNISYTKLHLVRDDVKALCEKHNVPYHNVSLFQAFSEFSGYNKQMALIARKGACIDYPGQA